MKKPNTQESIKELKEFIEMVNDPNSDFHEKYNKEDFKKMTESLNNLLECYLMLEEDEENDHKEFMKVLNSIGRLKTVLPKKIYMPNSKVVNDIIKFSDNDALIELKTNKSSSAKEISAYYTLSYASDDISISKNLTSYDREVYNAVTSLYVAGNIVITPPQVVRCMLGMTSQEKPTDTQIQEVIQSIDKMRSTLIEINATKQIEHLKPHIDGKKVTKYVYNDNLLNLRGTNIIAGGNDVFGYLIKEVPILYEYSHNVNQIISFDPKLLDTRKATRNTKEIISIKGYLLRRISTMKNTKSSSHSNRILYNTVFENSGIDCEDKNQLKRYRDNIKKILAQWVEEDFITYFIDYKIGKSIAGIEIFFDFSVEN